MDPGHEWRIIDQERARLDSLFSDLNADSWSTRSLCHNWSVQEVAAHLSAASQTGSTAWLVNMARCGFNTDRHNQRLLEQFVGTSFDQTLARYKEGISARKAPLGSRMGLLGEVIVHGQDIARALGRKFNPAPEAVLLVAEFFSSKDFAVNSRSMIKSISIVADDQDFTAGCGPAVHGELLDLVMAMAGRKQSLQSLSGPGVSKLTAAMA